MKRAITVAVAALVAASVLTGAVAGSAVAQDDLTGDATVVNDCTVINESGTYALDGDVTTNETATCIEIRADDVVLDGVGHAVEGPGPAENDTDAPAAGVLVGGSADAAYANVSVRNLDVAGFDDGVRSGSEGDATATTLEDVTVTDTERGVVVRGQDATLTDVTVTDSDLGLDVRGAAAVEVTGADVVENGAGVEVADTGDLVFENVSVERNDGDGLVLESGVALDSADSRYAENGGVGVVASGDGVSVSMLDDSASYNDGAGVVVQDGATLDMAWTAVVYNSGDGLVTETGATATVEESDIKSNDGTPFDATGGSATADEVTVSTAATVDFDDESVAFDPVAEADLPETPENVSAVADGLELSGGVAGQVDVTIAVDDTNDTDAVEVWRHDGEEWTTVDENPAVSDHGVEATVEAEGTVAAVELPPEEHDENASTDNESDEETPTPTETESEDDDDDSGSSGSSWSYSGSSSGGSSSGGADSSEETATPEPDETNETNTTNDTADANETTETDRPMETITPEDTTEEPDDTSESAEEGAAGDEVDEDAQADDEPEEESSLADGPGFGPLVALVALLASALLALRRR